MVAPSGLFGLFPAPAFEPLVIKSILSPSCILYHWPPDAQPKVDALRPAGLVSGTEL